MQRLLLVVSYTSYPTDGELFRDNITEAMHTQPGNSDSGGKLCTKKLWEAFRRGNDKALSQLFLRYYARLYRYGMKLLSDEDAVRDGVQQLFLKLWVKRNHIGEADSVTFYLLKSLRRILLRQKSQKVSRRRREQEYVQDFPPLSLTVEDKMVIAERKVEQEKLLKNAFQELTGKQKEVLFLRLQHGLQNKEIADVMDLSHQRVRNLIYEATQRLKDHIA